MAQGHALGARRQLGVRLDESDWPHTQSQSQPGQDCGQDCTQESLVITTHSCLSVLFCYRVITFPFFPLTWSSSTDPGGHLCSHLCFVQDLRESSLSGSATLPFLFFV
jgi:hypothetical protein